MRAHSLYPLKAAILFTLISIGVILPTGSSADPARPIAECRQQSLDQTGFVECLELLLEQSEAALDGIEEKWRTALLVAVQALEMENSAQTAKPQADSAIDPEKTEPAADPQPQPEEGVIAIVSGQTLDADVAVSDAFVINVDEENSSNVSVVAEITAVPGPEQLSQSFAVLPGLYRQYRDQRCQWQANLVGADRLSSDFHACVIALNQDRTLLLRRLLVEKRASDIAGESFRGYFVQTASGGNFQSCQRRQDWWVTGSDDVLQALLRRYDDITSENLEMVYIELRGRAAGAVSSGPGSDFVGSVDVSEINLMRPILDHDCGSMQEAGVPVIAEETTLADNDEEFIDVEDEPADTAGGKAVTIDDLGDAGFLYGYFSNWRSACAIDKLAVCQAQTQAFYSTEDAWIVSTDRSSNGSWRIRLVPTTENHVFDGSVQIIIDDAEISALRMAETEAEVNRGVVVAQGSGAQQLLGLMRRGQSLDFKWIRSDQKAARLSFSLRGITRALEYFDQAQ